MDETTNAFVDGIVAEKSRDCSERTKLNFLTANLWAYNVKIDDWTTGPYMIMGRAHHACAMRGKEVFVIGGEVSTRNSLEVWNGKSWSYSIGHIGASNLQLISQGRHLYLFGGWENGKLGNTIWKINHKNEFIEVGNTVMARSQYALFTLPHGFLTNCQGMYV